MDPVKPRLSRYSSLIKFRRSQKGGDGENQPNRWREGRLYSEGERNTMIGKRKIYRKRRKTELRKPPNGDA